MKRLIFVLAAFLCGLSPAPFRPWMVIDYDSNSKVSYVGYGATGPMEFQFTDEVILAKHLGNGKRDLEFGTRGFARVVAQAGHLLRINDLRMDSDGSVWVLLQEQRMEKPSPFVFTEDMPPGYLDRRSRTPKRAVSSTDFRKHYLTFEPSFEGPTQFVLVHLSSEGQIIDFRGHPRLEVSGMDQWYALGLQVHPEKVTILYSGKGGNKIYFDEFSKSGEMKSAGTLALDGYQLYEGNLSQDSSGNIYYSDLKRTDKGFWVPVYYSLSDPQKPPTYFGNEQLFKVEKNEIGTPLATGKEHFLGTYAHPTMNNLKQSFEFGGMEAFLVSNPDYYLVRGIPGEEPALIQLPLSNTDRMLMASSRVRQARSGEPYVVHQMSIEKDLGVMVVNQGRAEIVAKLENAHTLNCALILRVFSGNI